MDVFEKIAAMNSCGINDINDHISLIDGLYTAKMQHITGKEEVDGCKFSEMIESLVVLQDHYNSLVPSRENVQCSLALEKASLWFGACERKWFKNVPFWMPCCQAFEEKQYEHIELENAVYTARIAIGHPEEKHAKKGTYLENIVSSFLEIALYSCSKIDSELNRQTVMCLQEAYLWQRQRRHKRVKKGTFNTDKP